jgi:hypothetical protein
LAKSSQDRQLVRPLPIACAFAFGSTGFVRAPFLNSEQEKIMWPRIYAATDLESDVAISVFSIR